MSLLSNKLKILFIQKNVIKIAEWLKALVLKTIV